MNQIRAIQELNRKEIEQGITSDASWHTDYRDTAYVYFGGIPYELTEGDVITIFSQYGEPVFLKLVRDRETGRSKGFGWLKYEDQRSTDLAVDNLGGAEIAGRMVRVDHARYKPHEEDEPDEGRVDWAFLQKQQGRAAVSEDGDDGTGDSGGSESNVGRPPRPLLKEEKELAALMEGHDDDDPMKGFLVEEKKKEVEEARVRERERNSRKDRDRDDGEGSRRHHHHHHKRRRHDDDEDDESRDRGRRREDRHDDPDKKRQRRERSGDDDADRRRLDRKSVV